MEVYIYVSNHGIHEKGKGVIGMEFTAETVLTFPSGTKYPIVATGINASDALGSLVFKLGIEHFNIDKLHLDEKP